MKPTSSKARHTRLELQEGEVPKTLTRDKEAAEKVAP